MIINAEGETLKLMGRHAQPNFWHCLISDIWTLRHRDEREFVQKWLSTLFIATAHAKQANL